MNLALRRMRSAEDEAVSLRGELSSAKDEVAAGRAGFGEHHMTVAVRGDTLAEVDDGVAEVQAALADLGIIAVREDIELEPAFWAQFPGNFKYIARRGLISTGNFAGLASSHNFPLGHAPRQPLGRGGHACSRRPRPGPIISTSTRAIWAISPSSARRARARPWCSTSCWPRRASSTRASSSSTRIAAPNCSSARSAGATTCCAPAPGGAQPAAARRQPGQPPVPDRLGRAARGRRRHRRNGEDQGRGRRQFRPAGRASPAALSRRTVPRRRTGRTAADLWARLRPGGATASAPGCSTTSAT